MSQLSALLLVTLFSSMIASIPISADCINTSAKPENCSEKTQACPEAVNPTINDLARIKTEILENVEIRNKGYAAKAAEVPDDVNYGKQWGLAKVQASQAWNLSHGSSVIKIAILDSGIDSSHPELASKITVNKNFTESNTTEDKYGHGTFVAGIAAAETNNKLGIAGMGYNVSLMNVKVLGDNGGGSYAWIIRGIIWAADNGANVINLSMGGDIDSKDMQEAVDYAWSKGVVIVAASGNNGNSKPYYPAYYNRCIAVAATDQNDCRYSFSDFGSWVSVAAPGCSFSTMPGNSYETMGGTSMASPYVAGLAGLAFTMAKDNNDDGKRNDEIFDAILKGCDDVGVSGIGCGRINAYRTMSILYKSRITVPANLP